MTINTRLCGAVLLLAVFAGPVAAQSRLYPPPPERFSTSSPTMPTVAPPSAEALGVMPPGRPAAATGQNAVDRVTAPVRVASDETPDPVATLTGQPTQSVAPGVPPGSYPSPLFNPGPGCAGPLGANGRIGYEYYTYTGPTFAFGEGRFARQLHPGWMVGGGGKSLFFNTTHDAAWTADIGLSYQFNPGSLGHFTTLELRQVPQTLPGTNTRIPRPDVLAELAIRGLSRTNFNFAVGRDWWYWGPGSVGQEAGWNVRCGGLLGGRWGTAHIDEVPQNPAFGTYARRQGVTHGFFMASHLTVEVPMGTWILFGGLRTEYGYDWTNLVPPLNGNLHNFNILMTAGIRF